MIQKNAFVAGRVYSVVYQSDVDMVQKRDGKENPLGSSAVTVRRVSTIQAAGNKTWNNFKVKHGIVTSSARPDWFTPNTDNTCIVSHNKTGVEYLRGLPKGITKEVYMVNGIEASPEQVNTIRAFKKSQGESKFVMLTLDKLINVDKGEGDAE